MVSRSITRDLVTYILRLVYIYLEIGLHVLGDWFTYIWRLVYTYWEIGLHNTGRLVYIYLETGLHILGDWFTYVWRLVYIYLGRFGREKKCSVIRRNTVVFLSTLTLCITNTMLCCHLVEPDSVWN